MTKNKLIEVMALTEKELMTRRVFEREVMTPRIVARYHIEAIEAAGFVVVEGDAIREFYGNIERAEESLSAAKRRFQDHLDIKP